MFTPLSFRSIQDSLGLNNLQMIGIIAGIFIVLAILGAIFKISDKKGLRIIGHILHGCMAVVLLLLIIPKRFLAMAFNHGIKGILILVGAILAIGIILMWIGDDASSTSTSKKTKNTAAPAKPKQEQKRPRYMVADKTFYTWGEALNYSNYVKRNNLGPSNIVNL